MQLNNLFICMTYDPISYSVRADYNKSRINRKQVPVRASVIFHPSIISGILWLIKGHTGLCSHWIQGSCSILLPYMNRRARTCCQIFETKTPVKERDRTDSQLKGCLIRLMGIHCLIIDMIHENHHPISLPSFHTPLSKMILSAPAVKCMPIKGFRS